MELNQREREILEDWFRDQKDYEIFRGIMDMITDEQLLILVVKMVRDEIDNLHEGLTSQGIVDESGSLQGDESGEYNNFVGRIDDMYSIIDSILKKKTGVEFY